eukprot:TRINITY_DN9207_c0_g1_i1.p1 TRINITY_DN9207_c0_g1~~TRINITY_DN9207_c0_g1_i1.p1  ORF type:complete len:217 (-),score=38.11 TRINITY_DN9207_c0_g1_i1:8-583(-)
MDEDRSGYAKAHGVLMFLAWAVCGSLSIFIARFKKKEYGHWWFRLHWGINILLIVLVLTAFLCILTYLDWEWQFYDTHHGLGFIILLGMILQPILGLIAHKRWNPRRNRAPLWPDKIHWYIGYIIWITALFNIKLGMDMNPSWWEGWAYVIFYFTLAIIFTLYFVREKPNKSFEKVDVDLQKVTDLGKYSD